MCKNSGWRWNKFLWTTFGLKHQKGWATKSFSNEDKITHAQGNFSTERSIVRIICLLQQIPTQWNSVITYPQGKWKMHVLNKVRFIWKKEQRCPIGNVRDRRGERNNWVYALSRVRTNRVSMYAQSFRRRLVHSWWSCTKLKLRQISRPRRCSDGACANTS